MRTKYASTYYRSKNIISGYQNQAIQIMAADPTYLPAGGSDPGETLYWETTAKILRLAGFRHAEGGVTDLQFQYEVSIRYRDDKNIQNNMILKWRGTSWVIYDYEPDLVYQDYILFKITQANSGDLVVPQPT